MTLSDSLSDSSSAELQSLGQRAPIWPALKQLILAEIYKLLRNPMFAVGTIGFPIMFYAIFGLPNAQFSTPDGANLGRYMLAGFGGYSLISLALFRLGWL